MINDNFLKESTKLIRKVKTKLILFRDVVEKTFSILKKLKIVGQ